MRAVPPFDVSDLFAEQVASLRLQDRSEGGGGRFAHAIKDANAPTLCCRADQSMSA